MCDPEIDEPITSLGFVASVQVDARGNAEVWLRLPTFFCPANFAFLILADVRAAVAAVSGVASARVVLLDHFAATELNDATAGERGFAATFGELAAGELDDLRRTFLAKAVVAATDGVWQVLAASGVRIDETVALTLGDVQELPAAVRLRRRRAMLGLPAGDDAPLLLDPSSAAAVRADEVGRFLDRARLTRLSAEANAEICRGLLRHRAHETPVAVEPGVRRAAAGVTFAGSRGRG